MGLAYCSPNPYITVVAGHSALNAGQIGFCAPPESSASTSCTQRKAGSLTGTIKLIDELKLLLRRLVNSPKKIEVLVRQISPLIFHQKTGKANHGLQQSAKFQAQAPAEGCVSVVCRFRGFFRSAQFVLGSPLADVADDNREH